MFNVLERLELECIPGGIQEEHGCLFTGLTLKSSARLDDKFHALPLHARSQFIPVSQFQHDTEMRYGDPLAIDRVVVRSQPSRFSQGWIEMTDKLVPIKIEIDPMRVAAPLRT